MRNYTYEAWAPLDNRTLVEDALGRAHRYRNELCALELRRREAIDAATLEFSSPLVATESALAELLAEIERETTAQRAINQAAGTRTVSAERRAVFTTLRRRKRELYATRKRLRAEVFESAAWKSRQTEIEDAWKRGKAAARAAAGLFHGTADKVEERCQAFRRGPPPRFLAWRIARRKGLSLTVREKPGMPVQELLAGRSTGVRLSFPPGLAEAHAAGRRARGCASDVTLRFRIGSSGPGGRLPVWTTVRVRLDRPMPLAATVQAVYLHRSYVGLHARWQVVFALACEDERVFAPQAWRGGRPRGESGTVALDVGWRSLGKDGLRVAVWAGSDGAEGEIRMSAGWVGEYHRVEKIRSHRDTIFNEARDGLASWLRERTAEETPEVLREARSHVHQWRSPGRLAALVLRWREAGGVLLPALEEWRKRDAHLLAFEAHLRDQLQAGRRDAYRVAAGRIAARYARHVIEDMDLGELAHELPEIEDGGGDDDQGERVRWNPRLACLSQLREALVARMGPAVKVDPRGTTILCWRCSEDSGIEPGAAGRTPLEHRCRACGTEWDQDANAARVLLSRAGVVVRWHAAALARGEAWTYGGPSSHVACAGTR